MVLYDSSKNRAAGFNDNSVISNLGRSSSLAKLLTLETLLIEEIKPALNSKDEFKSRTLTLKLY